MLTKKEFFLSANHREARLVDEMALELLGIAELESDVACVQALLMAGFRGKDIGHHLDEARDLARDAVAVP
jgi:hypothetical protein